LTQGSPSDLKSRIEPLIPWLANRLRHPLGRRPLESGDGFGPLPLPLLSRAENKAKLGAAGFRTDFHLNEDLYLHAVGIAIE
jgi:hypothetical protein